MKGNNRKNEHTEMAKLVLDIFRMCKSGQHLVEHKKPYEISKCDTYRTSLSDDEVTVYKKHSIQDIVDEVM